MFLTIVRLTCSLYPPCISSPGGVSGSNRQKISSLRIVGTPIEGYRESSAETSGLRRPALSRAATKDPIWAVRLDGTNSLPTIRGIASTGRGPDWLIALLDRKSVV